MTEFEVGTLFGVVVMLLLGGLFYAIVQATR